MQQLLQSPEPTIVKAKQQLSKMLRVVINRAYLDGVDQIIDLKVEDGILKGLFSDEDRLLQFEIDKQDKLSYRLAQAKGFRVGRTDAPRKLKRQCGIGISCGISCISDKKSCDINLKRIATPAEISSIRATAKLLSPVADINKVFEAASTLTGVANKAARKSEPKPTPVEAKPPETDPVEEKQDDPLERLTIRELKKVAADNGVYRYSVMTKEELKSAIRVANEDPNQQERVRKTLERAEEQRNIDPVRHWRKVSAKQSQWKKEDITAAVIAGSVLLGFTLDRYKAMQESYKGNFAASADAAISRSRTIGVPDIGNKRYATFTVDGFSVDSDPNKGRNLANKLQEVDPDFMKKHHVVPIDGAEFTDLAQIPEGTPGLLKGPASVVLSAAKVLGTTLFEKSNPKAVELASQVYAYRQKYPQKQINLVGHGSGGMVVNEAIEILHAIDKKIPGDLRVVNIGTPNFGLTQQRAGKGDGKGSTLTVTSSNDPLNIFPKVNPITINTVRSHDLNDYLEDDRARAVILDGIGKNDLPRTRKPKPVLKKPKPKRGDSIAYLEALEKTLANG